MIKSLYTLLLCVGCSLIGLGQSSLFEGGYLSVNLPYQTTGGEMDGERILVTTQEVFLVPAIEGGFGYGLGIGARIQETAFEVHYNRTEHVADFSGSRGEAIMRVWSLDIKQFFMGGNKAQPYVHFAWTPAFSLKVKDASASINQNPEVRDSRFIGSINTSQLGLGISYTLLPRVNLNLGSAFRFTKYTGVAGGKDVVSARISEPLRGNGLNFFANLNIRFSKDK